MNEIKEKPINGVAVDGYCKGNPGPGGYRGVDISTGEILFEWHTENCTNNLAEFIGIVHGLGFIKEQSKKFGKNYGIIYSDSEVAISWVKSKSSSGTKFNVDKYPLLKQRIFKCEMFLSESKSLPRYEKWDTKNWGEIPADFGNKK